MLKKWSGGQDLNLRHSGFCFVCLVGWVTLARGQVSTASSLAVLCSPTRKLYQAELPPDREIMGKKRLYNFITDAGLFVVFGAIFVCKG
jgi:hypothetical protein